MVAAKDLNSNGPLFEGRQLSWIEEEAFIFNACQSKNDVVVTRYTSNIEFYQLCVLEISLTFVWVARL